MVELRETLQATLGPDYVIERELGGGGMSRVFVAHDRALGRRIVVKVLPPELAATVSVERFKREIVLVAGLQHPHVVGVLSAGETDGLPYFVMPFVEGESLRTRLQRGGPLPVRETVSILKDVARALAFAHERGIVHRDIKPDNVLLAGGSATVTDFGVAKALSTARQSDASTTTTGGTLTLIGTSLGTPAYMAPEQAAADPDTDHRADIYAFGIMAYEMLTGASPFQSKTPQALLAAHLTEVPPALDTIDPAVPPRLAMLVARCLEKERENRPQSAREIVDALEDPALVSGAFAATASSAARASGVRTASGTNAGIGMRRWNSASTWLRTAGAVAVLALAGAGVFALARARATSPSVSPTGAPAAATVAKSLVVLPLVNIGPDSGDAYLADGMTTELINALSRIPGLRVASRTASFAFKDRFASAAEIGKSLNVTMLLEGTVQRDRNRLRVTARLVNTSDGFMLWSDMYERELRDVFAVQDEISGSIAETLGEQMGIVPGEEEAHGTANLEAYDLYLRGRYLFQKRGAASLRQALALFRSATEKDPRFARAYAGMADVYALLPLYDATRADSVFPLALRAATRAVELDSTLAEGYASRAALLNAGWRWSEAERDFRRATALDGGYAAAHQWYGEHLLVRGRAREAVTELRRAAQLDPLSPVAAASLAIALSVAGERDAAIAKAREAVGLDSASSVARLMLGTAYVYAGHAPEAVAELEVALGLAPQSSSIQGMLGYAYAAGGQRERAVALLQSLTTRDDGDAAAAAAHIHLALGDTASALAALESAASRHASFFSVESMSAPIFDPLRASARFRAVLSQVGLDTVPGVR